MLAVEADGFEHHGTRRALRKDRRRHTELAVFRWSTLRFPFEDVMFQPAWTRWALRSWRVVRDGGVPDTPPLRMPGHRPWAGVSTATGSDTDRGASRARRNQPGRVACACTACRPAARWHGREADATGPARGHGPQDEGAVRGLHELRKDPRHPRAVGEERGRVVEGGQLLQRHDGRRQHPRPSPRDGRAGRQHAPRCCGPTRSSCPGRAGRAASPLRGSTCRSAAARTPGSPSVRARAGPTPRGARRTPPPPRAGRPRRRGAASPGVTPIAPRARRDPAWPGRGSGRPGPPLRPGRRRSRRERHRGHPTLHEHLRASHAVADDHHRGGGAGGDRPGRRRPARAAHAGRAPGRSRWGGGRRCPTAPTAPAPLPRPPHAPCRQSRTWTMTSTSTGASSGSATTPTAERACTPASPNTLPKRLTGTVDDARLSREGRVRGRRSRRP